MTRHAMKKNGLQRRVGKEIGCERHLLGCRS
jgi:hypothetical protein